MPDEQIFALFLSAVAGLKIDEHGVWSLPAELETTGRLARQTQERTVDIERPRERTLNLLATTTYLLVCGTGIDRSPGLPMDYPALLRSFFRERAALSDMLPPTPIGAADIREQVEHSERAVLHNGNWVEPRFTKLPGMPDPFDGCADCPAGGHD